MMKALEARLGCRPGQEKTARQHEIRANWEFAQWRASEGAVADAHYRAGMAYRARAAELRRDEANR